MKPHGHSSQDYWFRWLCVHQYKLTIDLGPCTPTKTKNTYFQVSGVVNMNNIKREKHFGKGENNFCVKIHLVYFQYCII